MMMQLTETFRMIVGQTPLLERFRPMEALGHGVSIIPKNSMLVLILQPL